MSSQQNKTQQHNTTRQLDMEQRGMNTKHPHGQNKNKNKNKNKNLSQLGSEFAQQKRF